MKTQKAQAGLEVLMALGILAIIFGMIYVVYTFKSEDLLRSKEYLKERGECLSLATSIGNVFTLGNNAQLVVPLTYTFTVDPAGQRLESPHAFCTIAISTIQQAGNGAVPFNVTGRVELQNKEGTIMVRTPT